MNNQDLFQVWLMEMDDTIQRFSESVPVGIAEKLDKSPNSLLIVEKFILDSYQNSQEAAHKNEASKIDGIARYVGEVFRINLGGKWTIELSGTKDVFFGLPQLAEMQGQRTPIWPLTLVTASANRRTGKFIRTIFDNMYT